MFAADKVQHLKWKMIGWLMLFKKIYVYILQH